MEEDPKFLDAYDYIIDCQSGIDGPFMANAPAAGYLIMPISVELIDLRLSGGTIL